MHGKLLCSGPLRPPNSFQPATANALRPPRPSQALRPRGVQLMRALLEAFGASADPMLEGARLLALYQAQVVSTLR